MHSSFSFKYVWPFLLIFASFSFYGRQVSAEGAGTLGDVLQSPEAELDGIQGNIAADEGWILSVNAPHGYVITSPIQTYYSDGTTVTLHVQPRQGYRFNRWTGDVSEGNDIANSLVLTMNANKSLVAECVPLEGGIVQWGSIYYQPAPYFKPTDIFMAISAGHYGSMGLKPDGSIVSSSSDPVPQPNSGFIAIEAGTYGHYLGLKADGTVIAWGGNNQGQCDVPEPNDNFIAIATGGYNSLGLKSNGSIVAWGDNSYGQCTVPEPNSGFVAVAAGVRHSVGLKSNGLIVVWGDDSHGKCRVPLPNIGFIAIEANDYHSLGLKSDGSIAAWGRPTGFAHFPPTPNTGFVAISAGSEHNLALKSDGTVLAEGWSQEGESDVPEPNADFIAVSGGRYHTLGLKQTGMLEVVIEPQEAAEAGVTWRVSGCDDVWRASGTSVSLPSGNHAIEFSALVPGWYGPPSQTLMIVAHNTVRTSALSTIGPMLSVDANNGYVIFSHVEKNYALGSGMPYRDGTTVTLHAQPRQGYQFSHWTGDVPLGSETTHSLTLMMDANKALVAEFVQQEADIVAWGEDSSGQRAVLEPNMGFAAVAMGYDHTLGLKSDGSVVAWGSNENGECTVPEPNSGFIAISSRHYHSLGLKSDGSLAAWGSNTLGQSTLPEPNSGFIAVAAGQYHSLGLKSDGSVVGWGYNGQGLCDVPEPNIGFVAIAAGYWHSLGLKSDGSIVVWGSLSYGLSRVPEPNSDFLAISTGSNHSLGLKTDGSVVAWGKEEYGVCIVPEPNKNYMAISARTTHNLGLKTDGSVVAWGENNVGQCTLPEPNTGYVAITAGRYHGLGLKLFGTLQVNLEPSDAVEAGGRWRVSGVADAWHESATSVSLPIGDYTVEFWSDRPGWYEPDPQEVTVVEKETVQVSAVYSNSLTRTLLTDARNGYVIHARKNYRDGANATLRAMPAQGYRFSHWTGDVPAGSETTHSLTLTMDTDKSLTAQFVPLPDARIVAWGSGHSYKTRIPEPHDGYVGITVGYEHLLGLKSDGSITAAGDNYYGQCTVPEPNADYLAVSAMSNLSMGLKADGSIVAWGENRNGQCTVPEPNADFAAIASGGGFALGLKTSGSIVAWGSNSANQTMVPEPNTDFVAISAGRVHALGLRSNGSIVAWGKDQSILSTVPEPNEGFVAIVAGRSHNLALKLDGSIVGWGVNTDGQCKVPEPNANFIAVAAGIDYSLGVKSDGSVVAWYHQSDVPKPNLLFVGIAAGKDLNLGLKSVGSLEVVIEPQEAVEGGARWRISDIDDTWRESATSVTLVCDDYTIEFLDDVVGWRAPSSQVVTVEADKVVQVGAVYDIGWALSVNASNGYIVQPPVETAYNPSSHPTHRDCTTVTLSAQPRQGYRFSNWTGDVPEGDETTNPLTLLMDRNRSLEAKFIQAERSRIVTWGDNSSSQCTIPNWNTDFIAVSAGGEHSLGLKSDGSVAAWGKNDDGQCTITEPNTGFVAVSAGLTHSLALKLDGSVVAWGNNSDGQCTVPKPNTDFIAISAGEAHSLGLKSNGSIMQWGTYPTGQYEIPDPNADFVALSAGNYNSMGLKSDGSIITWGYNSIDPYLENNSDVTFVTFSTGRTHKLALTLDGWVMARGSNNVGECRVPKPNADFIAVSAGKSHSLGLKSDGSVMAWGYNNSGQCTRPVPNTDFIGISAGKEHSLALKRLRGNLQVIIEPQQAAEAGARWRILGGDNAWLESGTSTSLLIGDYTIGFFDDVSSWYAPDSQTVSVVADETVRTSATYTAGLTWILSIDAPDGVVIQAPQKTNHRDGTTVTLTATSTEWSQFQGWIGDIPPGMEMVNPLILIMDANRSVAATFLIKPRKPGQWLLR